MLRIIDARTGEPVDAAPARRGLTRVEVHAPGSDTTDLRVLLVADLLVRALELGGTPVWALLTGGRRQAELRADAAALGIRPFEDSPDVSAGLGEAQVVHVAAEGGAAPDGVRIAVAPVEAAGPGASDGGRREAGRSDDVSAESGLSSGRSAGSGLPVGESAQSGRPGGQSVGSGLRGDQSVGSGLRGGESAGSGLRSGESAERRSGGQSAGADMPNGHPAESGLPAGESAASSLSVGESAKSGAPSVQPAEPGPPADSSSESRPPSRQPTEEDLPADGKSARPAPSNSQSVDPAPLGVDPTVLRLALLTRHHSAPVRLDAGVLDEAQATLARWRGAVAHWARRPSRPVPDDVRGRLRDAWEDDLDVPRVLDELRRVENEPELPDGARFETYAYADRLLGLELTRDLGAPS